MAVADLHEGEARPASPRRRTAPPIKPSVRGTPPLKVQTTPVPAQAMHFNRPRRFIFAAPDRSLSSRSAICLS